MLFFCIALYVVGSEVGFISCIEGAFSLPFESFGSFFLGGLLLFPLVGAFDVGAFDNLGEFGAFVFFCFDGLGVGVGRFVGCIDRICLKRGNSQFPFLLLKS